MRECPVCRATIFGRPDKCSTCNTPLERLSGLRVRWSKRLTPFLPGLGHLWLGYLVQSTLALFGTSVALFVLIDGLKRNAFGVKEYLIWSGFWLIWVLFWSWNISYKPRKFVSARQIYQYLFGMLLVVNIVMTFLIGILLAM
ncbi:MAG: hypothetical protein ABEJ65_03735 [bacterium]